LTITAGLGYNLKVKKGDDKSMQKKSQKALKNMVLSALFISIGLVLPFLTGQLKQIGNMLLPMHLPVFLCGLICGWKYGAAVGLVLPLLRSMLFSMPVLYPTAISMAFELSAYGLICGLIYALFKKQNAGKIYPALVISMLGGRAVWGIAQAVLLGVKDNAFTLKMFVTGAFVNALPGIVIQLVLIPLIMEALHRTNLHRYKNENE